MPWEGSEFQMWVSIAVTVIAMYYYITEKYSLEITSLMVLSFLLLFFTFFPVERSGEILDSARLIKGFANPALITVLALLVVGRGLVQTGILEKVAENITENNVNTTITLSIVFLVVAVLSAFLNNTPVVVIFIPVIQALAQKGKISRRKYMMPLSFVAILGGTVTLIGSSTNLLVSSSLIELGRDGLGFFEVTPIALVLASFGLLYVLIVIPRIIPDKGLDSRWQINYEDYYISRIVVKKDSALIGSTIEKTFSGFRGLKIERENRIIYPPCDELELEAGDVITVKAEKKKLIEAVGQKPECFVYGYGRKEEKEEELVIEAVVPPFSNFCERKIEAAEFKERYGCSVIGVRSYYRSKTKSFYQDPLNSGDTILLFGQNKDFFNLQESRNLILMAGSTTAVPMLKHAKRTLSIFLVSIGLAAAGIVPVLVSALIAATLIIVSGTLNLRQARRAIDHRIFLVVVSALALGDALHYTGGASYIAHGLLDLLEGSSPNLILSVFFLLVALMTNILSNNACAVLFTPIGINMAYEMGLDARIFALTVLLGANCSFASPVGYKTNLLVMGPGKYSFADFVKYGLPLVLLIWLVFTIAMPYFFNL